MSSNSREKAKDIRNDFRLNVDSRQTKQKLFNAKRNEAIKTIEEKGLSSDSNETKNRKHYRIRNRRPTENNESNATTKWWISKRLIEQAKKKKAFRKKITTIVDSKPLVRIATEKSNENKHKGDRQNGDRDSDSEQLDVVCAMASNKSTWIVFYFTLSSFLPRSWPLEQWIIVYLFKDEHFGVVKMAFRFSVVLYRATKQKKKQMTILLFGSSLWSSLRGWNNKERRKKGSESQRMSIA